MTGAARSSPPRPSRRPRRLNGFGARLAALPVRGYRLLISPLVAPSCRFAPSCSEYAVEALERHGAFHGIGLAVRRLLRCHPWGGHGFDPVPPARR